MYLTNQNDIYLYFNVINDIKPNSILDIGMFLKRIGAVSRSARGQRIDDEVQLDGVDLFEEIDIAVSNVVYNDTYYKTVFEESKTYDFVIMLRVSDMLSVSELDKIWKWSKRNAKYGLIDIASEDDLEVLQAKGNVRKLQLDENMYALVMF